jgi:hypothetical protein
VRVVHPLADPKHTIARELVASGTTLTHDLDPDGIRSADEDALSAKIDKLAHAVTSTTSLFARWGGSVPFAESTGGFGEGGTGRWGGLSNDAIGSIGHGSRVIPVDLGAQLQPMVASCELGTAKANVTIELTFQEIVDVQVRIEGGGARAPALKTCVEEIVWDFFPALPSLEPSRTEQIVLHSL